MIEANRRNWDARVPVHLDGGYDLDALRSGRQRLADFEYAAIEVDGRDVLHLQCHLGTDTICLARHGARAVGLDLSGASVEAARALAAECGVGVEYVRSDVYGAADDQPGPGVVLDWPYLPAGPLRTESAVSYDGTGELAGDTVSFEWTHGIGTLLDAVRAAGLDLTGFAEHDVSPWRRWPNMRDLGGGWWGWPEGTPRLPLLFSLRASRPA